MWGSLGDRLAGLGDALSTGASAHARQQRRDQASSSAPSSSSSSSSITTTTTDDAIAVGGGSGTMARLPPPPFLSSDDPGGGGGGGAESSAAPVEERRHHQQQAAGISSALGSIRGWTSAIAESTMGVVSEAQRALETEQARIRESAPSLFGGTGSGGRARDLGLPLDVEALRDAEVVYVTDRIVTMGHPHTQSSVDGDVTPQRKLAAIGHMLRKRHGGRYMVWNLSEVEYDASMLDDQVLTYKFPGSPSPPLGLLLKLLMSMESWLKADPRNVAVVHCLTGRGRTSTVLAAFLCWTGEAGFTDVNVALEYIARCKRLPMRSLTIPSQVRYAGYFANMLDGVRPSRPPLILKRIIMSGAPKFGKRLLLASSAEGAGGEDGGVVVPPHSSGVGGGGGGGGGGQSSQQVWGCAPYLQLFKAGNLIFTAAASVNYSQSADDLPFCSSSDGPVSFIADAVIQGDILLRCRHLTRSGQRVSMFRAAFHTGYVPPRVMRLTKEQLDGACEDRRFDDDFFLDLIFEACDEAVAAAAAGGVVDDGPEGRGASDVDVAGTSATRGTGHDNGDDVDDGGGGGGAANEAAQRRSMGAVGNGAVVSASAYDSMLHRDSRFWDVIAERREENMRRREATERTGGEGRPEDGGGGDDDDAPLSGPTIGRRRDFVARGGGGHTDDEAGGGGRGGGGGEGGGGRKSILDAKAKTQREKMSAFSIGEEFGLDAPTNNSAKSAAGAPPPGGVGGGGKSATPLAMPVSPQPKGKDTLMEALMDLEDEQGLEDDGEVVFGGGDDGDGDCPAAAAEEEEEVAAGIDVPSRPAASTISSVVADIPATTVEISSQSEGDVAAETALKSNTPSEDNTPNVTEEVGNHLEDVTGLESANDFEDNMADQDVMDSNEDFGYADDFDDLDDDAELEDLEVLIIVN
ncbi:hypothetical protein ACHAW5_009953 [Stephanodiscus triporus]|uniref:Phosphatidylinositol-3,4,5-trisphosphate 3-phosphatase n=1 Tax=Stephanodiscus triporus TaxID=2934178 RepID=A0ABD3NHC0_9STRA